MAIIIVLSISVAITARADKASKVTDHDVVKDKLLPSMDWIKLTNEATNRPSNVLSSNVVTSEQSDCFKNFGSWGKVEARNAIMQKVQELDSYNQGDGVAADMGKLTNGTTQVDSPATRASLKIFVSDSMPKNLLKAYHAKAVQYGGTLVFKGLPSGSFKELAKLVLAISGNSKTANETGSMQIDDEAFEKFAVKLVPSILLIKEQDYLSSCEGEQPCEVGDSIATDGRVIFDKIVGSIGVKAALEKFAANGDLSEEAKRVLKND